MKSVSDGAKKRCKDWRQPNARLFATRGAKKPAPRFHGILLLCRGRYVKLDVPHLSKMGATVRKTSISVAISPELQWWRWYWVCGLKG